MNALANTGSGTFERANKQRTLERVARDWCLTVRASQVVPIYPLDEDVQPGDVYVVTTPIEKLKAYWNKHGYLPIDHRFGRFQPSKYSDYYPSGAYGISKASTLPRLWQFPENTPSQKIPKTPSGEAVGANPSEAEAAKLKAAADEGFLLTDWPKAPRAGFPSYSFRIRRGESFNGALPVQGVPVMLGALGARDISGSITLTDAFTYGIDEASLRDDLYIWRERKDKFGGKPNKEYLADYGPRPGAKLKDFNYLRVVTRVYLVRSVNISMTNLEASDWKLSAGAPKEPTSDHIAFDDNKPEDALLKSLHNNIAPQTLTTDVTVTPAPSPNAAPAIDPGAADPEVAAKNPEEKRLAKEKERLAIREKELALAEKEEQLKQRKQKLDDNISQREFNERAFKQALGRSAMKDAFGGFVVPGGSLQMMSATNKTISMKETFTRPLVIGFHALEFPIKDNGELGPPVSTFNRVDFGELPKFHGLTPYDPNKWEKHTSVSQKQTPHS